MATKENYSITSVELQTMRQELNLILQRIAERLDKIEGIGGTSTMQDGLTIENSTQIVHGFNTSNEI